MFFWQRRRSLSAELRLLSAAGEDPAAPRVSVILPLFGGQESAQAPIVPPPRSVAAAPDVSAPSRVVKIRRHPSAVIRGPGG